MERENKSYKAEDIELILCPKCDFHVSSGFKERVIRAAQVEPIRSRRRFMPWIAAAVASAAVVALVFTLTLRHHDQPLNPGQKIQVSARQLKSVSPQDSPQNVVPSAVERQIMIAKADVGDKQSSKRNKIIDRRQHSNDENEKQIEVIPEVMSISHMEQENRQEVEKKQEMVKKDDCFKDDAPCVVFAQISEGDYQEPSGPMHILSANISGPMPMAPRGHYEIATVSLNREDPMEYVERIRQNIERVESFIRDYCSDAPNDN